MRHAHALLPLMFVSAVLSLPAVAGATTPTISWPTPAAIVYGTALNATQLDATTTIDGTFAYTPAAGTVLTAGPQTLSVTFTPLDTTDYTTATKTVTLTVKKANPAITWAAPAPLTYGTAVSATQEDATSPVTGSLAYSQPIGWRPIVGSHGLAVTLTPGDTTDYNKATASVTLTVTPAALTVTANNASRRYGAANPVFTDTISGFVFGQTKSVVSGAASLSTTATTSSPVQAYPIVAAQGTLAAANYTFKFVNGTLTVTQAIPVITWPTPAPITFGTKVSATQEDATANTAGTFTYSQPIGWSPSAGTHTLAVTLAPSDAIDYKNATASVTLTVDKATPAVTWAMPAPIVSGTALSATQLDAKSPVAGTFAYTPPAGTVLSSGSHTLSTTFTPSNPENYNTATATTTISVQETGGTLTITTTSCPGGTQGAAYAGCSIDASGGAPPYTFSINGTLTYPSLPEGIYLNSSTGEISGAKIGGQGSYTPELIVTDTAGFKATRHIRFAITGSNAFLARIFPSTSIFHHRVDAATTSLPVDASPAAPMYSGYLPETVKPFFGNTSDTPFPNGIPAIEVPYNQADVAVSTTVYQSYFTSGPIPANAPVEGTRHSNGDRHVLVYLEAGGGQNPALYEMWQGIYQSGPWTDSSNARWLNVASNALTTQGKGTSDAAGLPVGPLLANADEVIGTGTPEKPNGTIQHPIRFTLNHMVNYWVWPATETAGVGSCVASDGSTIPTESEISQATPPVSCTMSGPAGEIYRLKASVATPACATTSPQAAIIITAFRNYGIILADNGDSGGLIGTPDARWNDDDLSCITSLTLSDFEPVNVSSLMVSNTSGATSH
jgi:hypothetical protein